MITLHTFLVLDELGQHSGTAGFCQDLFDEMFADMDRSLREMGVGDLSVGKKIRKMSEIFYGHCEAYRNALGATGGERRTELGNVLKRNVTGGALDDEKLNRLIDYILAVRAALRTHSLERILDGRLDLDVKLRAK